MLTPYPNMLGKDGGKAFAVLPYEKFQQPATAPAEHEDLMDLMDLRAAKYEEKDAPSIPLSQVRRELGI